MARDHGLEDLIRSDLPHDFALSEKAMFGGWAWLLNGNLLVGARADGMLVRLGKDRDAWALARRRRPDVFARQGDGWLGRAGPEADGEDAVRSRLIEGALQFVRRLAPKG